MKGSQQPLTLICCLLPFLFLLLSVAVADEEVSGCGGFLSSSSELSRITKKKVDFSNVILKLVSPTGVVIEETECSPSGYYFLPIYHDGKYSIEIQGPVGWSIAPQKSAIEVRDNRCNDGNDLNFELIGFQITGRVEVDNCQGGGVSGVTLSLTDPKTGEIIKETKSQSNGVFKFENVFPTTYSIQAAHPKLSFSKEQISPTIHWNSLTLEETVRVSGFEVSGKVHSIDKEPISGVKVFLHRESSPESSSFVVSDDDGNFVLQGVPCGKYTLIPLFESEDTEYSIIPSEMSFSVKTSPVTLTTAFQVVGFTVRGKILDPDGKGVGNAHIFLNGELKGSSEASGDFYLEAITSGVYDIETSSDGRKFQTLKGVKLSPTTATLPIIETSSFEICGTIRTYSPSLIGMQRSIQIKKKIIKSNHQKEGEESLLDTIETSEGEDRSSFCTFLAAGDYGFYPLVTNQESLTGIQFSPSHVKVSVIASPVRDIHFEQVIVSIQGTVECLENPCGPSIRILLRNEKGDSILQTEALSSTSNIFQFTNQLPGKYLISVEKDSWCWQEKSVLVDASESRKDVRFVQTGYNLEVNSQTDTTLQYNDGHGTHSALLKVYSGRNRFCIEAPGTYELQPVGCVRFNQDSYIFHTRSNEQTVLKLVVSLVLIRGIVELHDAHGDVSVNAIDLADNSKLSAILDADVSFKEESGLYSKSYSIWVKPNQRVEIIPSSRELLFYPQSQFVQVSRIGCQELIPTFSARIGLWFSGYVSPLQSSVVISAIAASSDEVIKTTQTNSEGFFRLGPLYDDIEYELEASKDGFFFSRQDDGNFKAVKLQNVQVLIKDDQGAGLSGVLLSLSSERNYRKNLATQADGTATFVDILPGSYFLKPVLKEYEFMPSSMQLEVKEESTEAIQVVGKRVAFSCLGTVKNLNGDPEKNVLVIAVLQSTDATEIGNREETTTDSEGRFRIRGLKPDRSYSLSIHPSEKIFRMSPLNYNFTVDSLEDISGRDFVVFRKPQKYPITGTVLASDDTLKTLSVKLFADNQTEPISVISLATSRFFDFGPAEVGEYSVQIATDLPSRQFLYNIPSERVVLENKPAHVVLHFTSRPLSMVAPAGETPFPILILLILIVVGVFRKKEVLAFYRKHIEPRISKQRSKKRY